ncbi:peptidoglycan-binding protein [Kitasatospora sp. NPDC101155]|uniref:peptidoglycan-binding domain-containing protein n=1 Tax=Kitasatospora sp. NPDC101155 TaxID=3364097 RepID=UPI0037F7F800
MAIHSLVKRAAVAAATAAVAVIPMAGTASANTDAGYVGYGQANNWNAVYCVQAEINYFTYQHGLRYPRLTEDGYWGPATYNAVVMFQNQLISYTKHADGEVGPLTGNMLIANGDPTMYGNCRNALPTTY